MDLPHYFLYHKDVSGSILEKCQILFTDAVLQNCFNGIPGDTDVTQSDTRYRYGYEAATKWTWHLGCIHDITGS